MKTPLLIFGLLIGLSCQASAQSFSASKFKDHLGKTGTLCDTVYSIKIVSDTLTLLNMGAAYPNQKYTVAVKGNKVNLDYSKLKGKPLCVTGVFIMYKNRPEIDIAEPDQVNKREK